MTLDTGFKFSVNLLRELGKVNKGLLVSCLHSLLESLRQYRPGSLYHAVDRLAYQLDENLNEARDFLVDEVTQILKESKDDKFNKPQQEFLSVAIKMILTLGIIRSNIEDYLIVLSFLEGNYDK